MKAQSKLNQILHKNLLSFKKVNKVNNNKIYVEFEIKFENTVFDKLMQFEEKIATEANSNMKASNKEIERLNLELIDNKAKTAEMKNYFEERLSKMQEEFELKIKLSLVKGGGGSSGSSQDFFSVIETKVNSLVKVHLEKFQKQQHDKKEKDKEIKELEQKVKALRRDLQILEISFKKQNKQSPEIKDQEVDSKLKLFGIPFSLTNCLGLKLIDLHNSIEKVKST